MAYVSIITPTYNHALYIAECLDSVLAQTYTDWEMIVVDDGSHDATLQIAQTYATRDPRIRVFHQPNTGAAKLDATYNFALAHSTGDLVAILEGDDYWPPHKLALQVAAHSPSVIMSYGKFMLALGNAALQPGPTPPFVGALDSFAFLRHLLLGRSHMLAVTQLIARRVLDAIGGFHQDGSPAAVDMATLLRLSQQPGEIVFVPEVLGYWRQHGAQSTNRNGIALALHNQQLALGTLRNLDLARRQRLDLNEGAIIAARRPQLADVYFAATRAALQQRDRSSVQTFAAHLWRYGDPKRKVQAVYARLAAPLGLTFEPILNAATKVTARVRRS